MIHTNISYNYFDIVPVHASMHFHNPSTSRTSSTAKVSYCADPSRQINTPTSDLLDRIIGSGVRQPEFPASKHPRASSPPPPPNLQVQVLNPPLSTCSQYRRVVAGSMADLWFSPASSPLSLLQYTMRQEFLGKTTRTMVNRRLFPMPVRILPPPSSYSGILVRACLNS